MSIKDELQHVKEELSSDEKLLESAFKLERFYKKYKILIWGFLLLLVVGFGGNAAWEAYRQNKLAAANDAFLALQKDPADQAALAKLQANNPKLLALFQLHQALTDGSADRLKALEGSSDPIVADVARYHAGLLSGHPVDSVYYHDLSVIEEAYADLKAGKKSSARDKLSLIAETSPVARIAQLLKHATLELK